MAAYVVVRIRNGDRSAIVPTDSSLSSCIDRLAAFTGKRLANRVAELEFEFARLDKAQIEEKLRSAAIDAELLSSAKTIKQAAAQIDVALHAIGILTILPAILEDGEHTERLSLGAGSSETKRFDLETNHRLAEFTFIDWRGNDSTRLQKIFKDFYRLVEFESSKRKELWVTDDSFVLKYMRSGSSVRSATHKHRDVWEKFQEKYSQITTVGEYYRRNSAKVVLRVIS